MPTECISDQFDFARAEGRSVVAAFDGGRVTSDAGALLLGATDRAIGLVERFAACFADERTQEQVVHPLAALVGQRVFAMALGYEDVNDHDRLRHDPVLGALSGRLEARHPRCAPLAGKSTLNRLERTSDGADRYKKVACDFEAVDELLTDLYLEAHKRAPRQIVLDHDATDTPLHGRQEGRFFHGYYGCYCYLPLYIFAGEHLLCARQRTSNQDAAAGSVGELARIVKRLRRRWPKTRIVVRADSGFCREELMSWCESNKVEYVLGLARNERLHAEIVEAMAQAAREHERTGKPERRFVELEYRTLKSWSRTRRVVAKAEQLEGKQNPRFVVTSLNKKRYAARRLYERFYCARGEMENRIKEQLSLFSDRMSTQTIRANQMRLYFSGLAYTLMLGLRRRGLEGTAWARLQTETLRRRLLKVGTRVRVTARRVWLSLAESWPWRALFETVFRRLCGPTAASA